MEQPITLPTTTRKTIISRGKEIQVISKTRFPKPVAVVDEVTLPESCPASEQQSWTASKGTSRELSFEDEIFSANLAAQIANFKGRKNRGSRGKK